MFLELRYPQLSADMVRNNFHCNGLTSRHFNRAATVTEHEFLGFFMRKSALVNSFMWDPEMQNQFLCESIDIFLIYRDMLKAYFLSQYPASSKVLKFLDT